MFVHHPHPHIEARKRQGPIKSTLEHDHVKEHVGGFNDWLGLHITRAVGTMWCAYAFAAISLTSLPAALATHSTTVIVSWIAQTFLQLVLLSVILVGQNIQSRAADKRAEQTYNDAEAVLHEALEIQRHLAEQDKALERLVALFDPKKSSSWMTQSFTSRT